MTELNTVTTGPPPTTDTVTVLWVHGVDSDTQVWDAATELVAVSHPCVSVDLPGHGDSPEPSDPASYERLRNSEAFGQVMARFAERFVGPPEVSVNELLVDM